MKYLRRFNESREQTDEMVDALRMIFIDIDQYYQTIEPHYNSDQLASVTFTELPRPYQGSEDFSVQYSFDISQFVEKIEQLKSYIDPSYRLLYSYRNSQTQQTYIKRLPKDKEAYSFKISVFKPREV